MEKKEEQCDHCGAPAHVTVAWNTSCGPQRALMCQPCGLAWWGQHKNGVGTGAIFSPVVPAGSDIPAADVTDGF